MKAHPSVGRIGTVQIHRSRASKPICVVVLLIIYMMTTCLSRVLFLFMKLYIDHHWIRGPMVLSTKLSFSTFGGCFVKNIYGDDTFLSHIVPFCEALHWPPSDLKAMVLPTKLSFSLSVEAHHSLVKLVVMPCSISPHVVFVLHQFIVV